MFNITSAVMKIVEPFGFDESKVYPPSPRSMTAWLYTAESDEFKIEISRDRGGLVSIAIGSRVRRRPRAHMRGPWSLSHLRAYLEGDVDHYKFSDFQKEISWLKENLERILNTSFLNSDELNEWAVNASLGMFDQ